METIQEESAGVPVNVKIQAENVSDEKVDIGPTELGPGETYETEKHNLVVEDGLKYLAEKFTSGFSRSEEINVASFGDENSSTTIGMTSIQGNEFARGKVPDSRITKVGNNETKINYIVGPGEPASQPQTFGEVALFDSSNSFMFARIGLGADEFQKTSEIEVRVQWQIGFVNQ